MSRLFKTEILFLYIYVIDGMYKYMLQTKMNAWNMASVIKGVKICREVTAATVTKDMNLHLTSIPAKLQVS